MVARGVPLKWAASVCSPSRPLPGNTGESRGFHWLHDRTVARSLLPKLNVEAFRRVLCSAESDLNVGFALILGRICFSNLILFSRT